MPSDPCQVSNCGQCAGDYYVSQGNAGCNAGCAPTGTDYGQVSRDTVSGSPSTGQSQNCSASCQCTNPADGTTFLVGCGVSLCTRPTQCSNDDQCANNQFCSGGTCTRSFCLVNFCHNTGTQCTDSSGSPGLCSNGCCVAFVKCSGCQTWDSSLNKCTDDDYKCGNNTDSDCIACFDGTCKPNDALCANGETCQSDGTCKGGCVSDIGATCATDVNGMACGSRNCDGTCDDSDCDKGPVVGSACGNCGSLQEYGYCNDPCCCGGGPGADDCGGCAVGAECRDIWGTPECIWSADPILIDLSGDGFSLTDVQHGVMFDFFRTGTPIRLSWTQTGAQNGWLVLDLNLDGKIDNGQELFGNAMPAPGPAGLRMGFKTLALYDTPPYGGNGDGKLDAKDRVFSRLKIWVDTNHNGVSDPGELMTLAEAGIKSISMDYKNGHYADAYGNQFQYRASVTWNDPKQNGRQHWAYDVVLVSPDLPSSQSKGAK